MEKNVEATAHAHAATTSLAIKWKFTKLKC